MELSKSSLIVMSDGGISEGGANEMGCGCGDFAGEGFDLFCLLLFLIRLELDNSQL
jgi:hypothetical protein